MEPLTVEERMHKYNIRQDRAEVLVPALNIYTSVLKWANIDEIYVPKIGLADGLIHHLYDQVLEEELK
jgi:exopolyphosphatase/guanosine-5'-triphosphate,3'-diphosphate pyrophosphatase